MILCVNKFSQTDMYVNDIKLYNVCKYIKYKNTVISCRIDICASFQSQIWYWDAKDDSSQSLI